MKKRTDLAETFANESGLRRFDHDAWFTDAYFTIQRTLHHGYVPLSPTQKTKLRDLLFAKLPELKARDFDIQWENLLRSVIRLSGANGRGSLSFGHAQKIASIIVKYAYVAWALADKKDFSLPQRWNEMIERCQARLPIPLDNIVLNKLMRLGVVKEGPVHRANKNLVLIRDSHAGQPVRWSRLNDATSYWNIQSAVQARASGDPMLFELPLWRR